MRVKRNDYAYRMVTGYSVKAKPDGTGFTFVHATISGESISGVPGFFELQMSSGEAREFARNLIMAADQTDGIRAGRKGK